MTAARPRPGMPLSHVALAVLVVAIWGTNFVVIRHGLQRFPPFTFAALRFGLVALATLWFVPFPKVRLGTLVAYGLLIGPGQFGLMLFAMAGHIQPGLASLLIQTQAFFTVALAVVVAGERATAANVAALALCAVGVALIGFHTGGDADALGIVLVLGAALAWGAGNVVAKRAGDVDMLGLVAWSSVAAAVPLAAAALLFEGPRAIGASVAGADVGGWMSVAWQALGNALFGYVAWNWLLARHPAAEVAPMGLLVPVFGMSASAWLLSEAMSAWKLLAAAIVLAGLLVNVTASRRAAALAARSPA